MSSWQPASRRGVALSWSPVPGAVSYEVFRTLSGELGGLLGETSEASFLDDSAAPGVEYAYRVRAIGDGTVGPISDALSGTRTSSSGGAGLEVDARGPSSSKRSAAGGATGYLYLRVDSGPSVPVALRSDVPWLEVESVGSVGQAAERVRLDVDVSTLSLGVHHASVTASSAGLEPRVVLVSVEVLAVGSAPTIDAPAGFGLRAGTTRGLRIRVADSDGDTVSVSLWNAPAYASLTQSGTERSGSPSAPTTPTWGTTRCSSSQRMTPPTATTRSTSSPSRSSSAMTRLF